MFPRLFWRLKTLLGGLPFKKTDAHSPTQIKYSTTQETLTDYTEEFINFKSGELRLCGTLTRPKVETKCPAVVLIHGSGPHTRDEIIGPHRVFQLLADYLSRRGIAVLRYDKRGVPYSEGNYAQATSFDFANDAEAAFNFLRSRDDIDTERIGLIGHSEGGLIAPLVATRAQVAFIVLLAAPAIPAEDILVSQITVYDKIRGLNNHHIKHNICLSKQAYAILRAEPNNLIAAQKLMDLRKGHPDEEVYRAFMDASIPTITSNWFRYFLHHDPRPVLSSLTCPILALNGDKDTQVLADENLTSIKTLARNPKTLTVKLPGLNHIFQPCTTGLPDEYETLPDTMSPVVLQIITHWIQPAQAP